MLIPTYNNAATLARVLEGVLEYTSNIIVINDGSTDATKEVLKDFKGLRNLSYLRNKGKGHALRKGFQEAWKMGFEHAVTIDSDGQHFPSDLPVFIEALENHQQPGKDFLIVGARKMDAPQVPDKSSVGNRFSSFSVWAETGVDLQDTQCGYRLYPLRLVNSLNLFSNKYELEIEVLVKAAWEGAEIINLPVKVLYDPEERVTHFRPFTDVARITVLNLYFVGAGLFYYLPRKLLRALSTKSTKVFTKNTEDPLNL